jgi:hypothetical protein
MEIEWTESALADMAVLDKGIARRIQKSVERFSKIALVTSSVFRIASRPNTVSASAITVSASSSMRTRCLSSAFEIGRRRTAEPSPVPNR